MTVVTANQGDTVADICYRNFGGTDAVEIIYDTNPGLAAHGPILPMGTKVVLPNKQQASNTEQTISLWD